MLQTPQELICRRQLPVFGSRKKPFVAKSGKGQKSASVPNPGLAASIKALQALNHEFDVADPAWIEFDVDLVARSAFRGQLLIDSLPSLRKSLDGRKIGGG